MQPPDAVLRFLESVGRRSEADFYLNLFRALPKERFAAIAVDANVARHATEAVVLDLRFLAQLGLVPLVVFGLLHPSDSVEHAARIRRRLEKSGVRAILLDPRGPTELVLQITEAANAGVIPILALGQPTDAGSDVGVDAGADAGGIRERFAFLATLLTGLVTRKVIFLHRPGGLRQKGALLTLVNLTTDVAPLLAGRDLSRKERVLVAETRRLVFDLVPHRLVCAITSPLNLFRELFTIKGAGTLLRRGALITRHEGYAGVDEPRLQGLLASSFGRPPEPEFFGRPAQRVYVEESYRGAAIVSATPLGPYLTKFAVEREAQGEGLGRDLWDVMTQELPSLFWRARSANPINEWYTRLADGLVRTTTWTIYWKGLPHSLIPAAIDFALEQPIDIPPVVPPLL